MSDMNKPEMTAQVLVAVGAVFLLISAYVMGEFTFLIKKNWMTISKAEPLLMEI